MKVSSVWSPTSVWPKSESWWVWKFRVWRATARTGPGSWKFCALTQTLIREEDGFCDPAHYYYLPLLGLKGTMSEAELHVLKARLVGGPIRNAQCGDLNLPLPTGLICDEEDRVVVDID